jgi:hypothetical protein
MMDSDRREELNPILALLSLAKELHDSGRNNIIRTQFFDTLDMDSFYENVLGVISVVFDGFHNDYKDDEDYEIMVFSDDVIAEYFLLAWEYGQTHRILHNANPFVIEAEREINKHLGYCFSISWKLLGYTKTKRTAKQSKLIVCAAACESCDFDSLAQGLLQTYQFFKRKCEEHTTVAEMDRVEPQKGAIAA